MAKTKQTDGCPDWADMLIAEIRRLEFQAGNIIGSTDWLERPLFSEDEDNGLDPDVLFEKLVCKLDEEGFSIQQIVSFVNSRIYYEGGPKYCNEMEVKDLL